MMIHFDDAWLGRQSSDFTGEILIEGRAGAAPVHFKIPRSIALKHFSVPETGEARPGIQQWAATLKNACQAAFERSGGRPVGEILVGDADFSSGQFRSAC